MQQYTLSCFCLVSTQNKDGGPAVMKDIHNHICRATTYIFSHTVRGVFMDSENKRTSMCNVLQFQMLFIPSGITFKVREIDFGPTNNRSGGFTLRFPGSWFICQTTVMHIYVFTVN